jgi:ADP-heptose:LPS heptosyltransferase
MLKLFREISLALRRRDSARDERRVLTRFARERTLIAALPAVRTRPATLLLIRLDDIGDYLLFRNQLASYRASPRWHGHRITLLANDSWRELFEALDADTVDEVMWVNKRQYLESEPHRSGVWRALRERGFETLIATSRTRPLLLDDLCRLAAAPLRSLGCVNTYPHGRWNRLSDGLYEALFSPSSPLLHEFCFNGEFTEWACGVRYAGKRPHIALRPPPPLAEPYLLCFIGASTRSRRWPVRRWCDFIRAFRKAHAMPVFLAGNNRAELEMVRVLERRTDARSLVGRLRLADMLSWIGGASAVVSNDTMASHLGVSLDRPTVIIGNGYNYLRFSEYVRAGITQVRTVYPKVFEQRRRERGEGPYEYHETVTADIASIPAGKVLEALEGVLRERPASPADAAADTKSSVDAVPPALEDRADLSPFTSLVEQDSLTGAD